MNGRNNESMIKAKKQEINTLGMNKRKNERNSEEQKNR